MKRSVFALFAVLATGAYAETVTPANLQGWHLTNQQGSGTAAITPTYPESGNGSLEMSTSGTGDKADFELDNSTGGFGSLSGITAIGYDYYRDSTSTANGILAPAERILFCTSSHACGQLVYEPVYNNGNVAVPTNTWTTVDATNGYWWLKFFGQPVVTQYNHDINYWVNDPNVGDASIFGIQVGVGSGWSGNFLGAVDNVELNGTTYNFETSAVPEPASASLLIIGIGLIGAAFLRRRHSASTKA